MDNAIAANAIIASVGRLIAVDTSALGLASMLAVGWTTFWIGLWVRATVMRWAHRSAIFN